MGLIGYTASDIFRVVGLESEENGKVRKRRLAGVKLRRLEDFAETTFGHIRRMFVPNYGYCYSIAYSMEVEGSKINKVSLNLNMGADLFLHEPGV